MRVVHVVHSYAPETVGGTQGYVARLAARQRASGMEPVVLAGSNELRSAPELRRESVDGVPVLRVLRAAAEVRSGDLGSARVRSAVVDAACGCAPALVHLHHWQTLSNDLVRGLAARGIPTVVTLHDLFVTCPRSFRMPDHRHLCPVGAGRAECAACLEAELAQLPVELRAPMVAARRAEFEGELASAATVLAVSDAAARLLRDLGVASDVLPLGFDEPDAVPPPRPAADGVLRIVTWGGVDPRKGLHVLLEAIAGSRLRDAVELHVHGRRGEPGYQRELDAAARGCRVTWHGPFADGERAAFAARYDVAVFPHLAFETHGFAVDEALCSGLPVVTSDRGAPRERLGSRGVAFAAGDAAALRGEIERLCGDRAALRRMRAAPHGVRSLREHEAALQTVYRRVVGA
jgi:glycosyltransferase involved in cell wall biosynthesis